MKVVKVVSIDNGKMQFCSEECRREFLLPSPHVKRGIQLEWEKQQDTCEVQEPSTCDTCACRSWSDGKKTHPIPNPNIEEHQKILLDVLNLKDDQHKRHEYGPWVLLVGWDIRRALSEIYWSATDGAQKSLSTRLLEIEGIVSFEYKQDNGLELRVK
jgi:hypothetical protein